MVLYLILAVAFALAGYFVPGPQWLKVGFYVVAGLVLLLAALALVGYLDGPVVVRRYP